MAAKGGFKKDINLTIKKKEATSAPAPTPIRLDATVKDEFESGKRFVLNNVYFEQGSYILSPGSNSDLDALAKLMKENPKTPKTKPACS